MQLRNEFEVRAPIERVWEHLLDVERVAPCMPGAELTEVVDDHTWKGRVKMRLGPVSLAFAGTVQVVERDDQAHRVQLRAEGREQRGQGSATATATSRLESVEGGTRVVMETDLTITGKVAQYGRGMLGDISQRLTQEFATCLQSSIGASDLTGPQSPAAAIAEATASAGGVSREALSGPGESGGHTEAAAAAPDETPATGPKPEAAPPTSEPREGPAPVPEPWTAATAVSGATPPPHPVEVTPGVPARPGPTVQGPATRPGPAVQRPVAKPVQGFRLFAWALWRALVRLARRIADRLSGRRQA